MAYDDLQKCETLRQQINYIARVKISVFERWINYMGARMSSSRHLQGHAERSIKWFDG